MKQALDPNYYHQNYVPKQEEDASILVNNLVAPPAKTKEEEDQGEDTEEENKGEDTKEEADREEDKGNKTQAEDSGQEADDEDFSDCSGSDYIY